MPVYEGIMALLHEVVHCQPMTFLPDFTLPGDLAVFLGSTYSDLLEERSTPEPFGMKNLSVLDRLFEEGSEEQVEKREEEEMKIMQMLAREEMTSSMDLGRTILRRGPPCSRKSDFFNFFKRDFVNVIYCFFLFVCFSHICRIFCRFGHKVDAAANFQTGY